MTGTEMKMKMKIMTPTKAKATVQRMRAVQRMKERKTM